ncbi:MAG: beta-lactamase family protein [Planctomycetes bacterium]|nr:beta-lactamase family protein [Planctomycetota bacterium]
MLEGQQTYDNILAWAHQNGAPGAILCVKTPHEEFIESVGYADRKQRIPMRTDHAFRIGSVTKTFVGLVMAQLVAEGKVRLEDPIAHYLPASIADPITNSDIVTLRQLLRHQSGIYDYDENWRYNIRRYILQPKADWPPERSLRYAFGKPEEFPPGEGWSYSNSNYLLAAFLIDHVVGRHHSMEIRDRILDPLGLNHTYYEHYETPASELAHGYTSLGLWAYDARHTTPLVGGEAGLVSTVSDLVTFARAVFHNKDFVGDPVWGVRRGEPNPALGGKTRRVERYPVLRNDFGVFLNRADARSPWFFGHFGRVSGYACFVWHEPTHDITISFFLSKISVSGKYDRLLSEAAHALFELSLRRCESVAQSVKID